MEITLFQQAGSQALVMCDGQSSHMFDLLTLVPNAQRGIGQPLDDPVAFGKAIYEALFPMGTPARHALDQKPERIFLVSESSELDAVPWEYAYGPNDFLVLECHFVRGLPLQQRITSLKLENGLHIVAVPSNPLSHELAPLNIDGEWMRLKEIVQELPYAITLERTRPPTLERTGLLVANQRQRIVHFMGHGGQDEKEGAILCFEKEDGRLDLVTAKDFMRQIRGRAFLVTLNACVSATPSETHLSNLAQALVRQHTPYALGMRFSIPDEDALTFSRTFYSYLARGVSVEEAVYRVRLALSRSRYLWMVGMPILYTSLSEPSAGFATTAGTPIIEEHQPYIGVSTALPRAEGTFQGRIDDLAQLGALTGEKRSRIVTIHGGGGQGKTALAREAVERFAFAWPGGVWAATLESLPTREVFVTALAQFLGILKELGSASFDPGKLETQVMTQLVQRRIMIVLDNAETLVDAVEAHNAAAIHLAQFIQQLPGSSVSLLVTSRIQLGWPGEISLELGGLSPEEGATLFRQSAPQQYETIDMNLARQLSRIVEGHPLSLRLLGGAFNRSGVALSSFIEEHQKQLATAENKYVSQQHRQRTLYASINTSVRYLDTELRALLSKLWIFHAPFLPEIAVALVDLSLTENVQKNSLVHDRLHILWQRGLLTREIANVHDGTMLFYRLLPTMRPYVEQYLAQEEERATLLTRFGEAYAHLVYSLHNELDRGDAAALKALLLREDLERGASHVTGIERGYYLLAWGWILQRLGDRSHGLELTEQALEIGQSEQDNTLCQRALYNMARVYHLLGQPQRALELYEQVLPIRQAMGDRAGEVATLSNIAGVYLGIGQPQHALELFEQVLPIRREVEDLAGDAATLNNMAGVYLGTGQPQRALELFEQALPMMQASGDLAGEVATLTNIASVLQDIGQPQRALELFEQVLPIRRTMGDRAGEAVTHNNMALAYQGIGQPQRALELFDLALPVLQEVGDRTGEAATLNNMAAVYHLLGEPQRALKLFDLALPIRREVGDRAGEAVTLGNMARLYRDTGQLKRALELYEQALPISREVGDREQEASNGWSIENIKFEIAHPIENREETMQAVSEFVGTENWIATRQVLEAKRDLLFQPEVEATFEQNIIWAQSEEDEQKVILLEQRLSILRSCKQRGIAETFEQLSDEGVVAFSWKSTSFPEAPQRPRVAHRGRWRMFNTWPLSRLRKRMKK